MAILIDDLLGEDADECLTGSGLSGVSTEDLIKLLSDVFEEVNRRPQKDIDDASENVLSGIING